VFIKEIDLFKGMGVEIIDEIFKISVVEYYKKDDILFKQGDPAHDFYLLEEGEIRLTIGEEGQIGFTMNPGDAFGWSSLAGRDVYTATAECKLPCKLIKIEIDKLDRIFEKYPDNGLIFFKGVAKLIGERLIRAYDMVLSAQKLGGQPSYG
jgi:CRP-like cAMP-binding protein